MKELLSKMIHEIFNKIASYQRNSSRWYFKEVLRLEIHTIDYKLQTYKTKTKNVFSGQFLDIFMQ